VVINGKLISNTFVTSKKDQNDSIKKIKSINGLRFIFPGHGECVPFDNFSGLYKLYDINKLNLLDSGFRRNDDKNEFSTFYEFINNYIRQKSNCFSHSC